MVKEYSNNSIFLAVLICVILIYTGLVKVKTQTLSSLLELDSINTIQGKLQSSPVKTSKGKYYSAVISVDFINSNDIKASAYGSTKVLIPTEMIEAYYPGKIFTKSKNNFNELWEAGGYYSLEGNYSNDFFIVSKCNYAYFSKNLFGKIDFFRGLCRLGFKRMMYTWKQAGGLLLALLSGSREYLEEDTKEAFKSAGLSHILALSGMHLSMLSNLSIYLSKKIGRKKLSYIIRILVLIIFVWFAGFSPSLLRAFICSFLLLLSSIVNTRKADMLIILSFSFLIQLLLTPEAYSNTGFILSYSALAGILLTGKIFNKLYSKILPRYFTNSLSASTGAQCFTIPISLKFFGSFAPIGIIATTFVSPLINIFIYSGLALIVIGLFIPALVKPSGIFMNILYTMIKFMVTFFSKCPMIKI